MDISSLTIRLLFLFLPGIISLVIIDHLTVHNKIEGYKYFLNSFLLGFLNYSIYVGLLSFIPGIGDVKFFEVLLNDNISVNYSEVIWVSLIAVVIGIGISYLIKYRIIFRFLRWIKVTGKSGDIDVWNYVFSSNVIEFATIRDYERDLMFVGTVKLFSEKTKGKDELFLVDVKVYTNSTAEFKYDVPAVYFSMEKGRYEIEFTYTELDKLK